MDPEDFRYVKGTEVVPCAMMYEFARSFTLRTGGDAVVRLTMVPSGRIDYWIDITGTNWFFHYNDLSYKTPAIDIRNAADPSGDAPANSDPRPFDSHGGILPYYKENKFAAGPLLQAHEKRIRVVEFLDSLEKERMDMDEDSREGCPEDRKAPSMNTYCLVTTNGIPLDREDDGTDPPLITPIYFKAYNHGSAYVLAIKYLKQLTEWCGFAVYLCDENNKLLRQLTREELEGPKRPQTFEEAAAIIDKLNDLLDGTEEKTFVTVKALRDILEGR